ncbi:MAG: hypothetical protein AB1410_00945 [Acidobacteriota bacterium]
MKYLLIVIMAIIAIIGWLKPRVIPSWLTIAMVFLIILGAIIQFVIQRKEYMDKEISKYAGKLENKSKTILLDPQEKQYPQFEFGDSGAILDYRGPEGSPLFKIFEDNCLTIWTENGNLKISTIIRNKKGEVVAELLANEWKIKKEKAFDRNFTKDALEVKDETGDIVLQIRVKDNRVQFQGKFYDGNGQGIAFGKIDTPQGAGGIIEITCPDHPILELKIKPIFKYPSEMHLGKLL